MAKFIRITFLTIFFISCSDDVKTKSSVAFSDKDCSDSFNSNLVFSYFKYI
ncbi:MAG: hypothetical protein HOH84_06185 [Flavobacteriaceae bacterium]|nr:hypothetical protein [Flavobacteriaceae bacterium]